MTKKYFLCNLSTIIITCLSITIFSCKARVSSNNDSLQVTNKTTEPPIVYCDTPINIYENKEMAVNKLKNLMSLSYSTTYSQFYTSSIDTVIKDKYRYKLAKKADSIIKANFENIKFLDNDKLLASDYKFIAKNTSLIGYYRKYDNIKDVLIPTNNEKQLFITTRSYGTSKGNLEIFVFNTYKKELLYYNKYQFNCDLRDSFTFEQIVEYAILQLKQSID